MEQKGGKNTRLSSCRYKNQSSWCLLTPNSQWTPASFFFLRLKSNKAPFPFFFLFLFFLNWADSSHFLNSAFLRDTVFSTTYSPEHGKTLLHNFCGITVKHLLHMDIKKFANFLWVTLLYHRKSTFVQTCPFKGFNDFFLKLHLMFALSQTYYSSHN